MKSIKKSLLNTCLQQHQLEKWNYHLDFDLPCEENSDCQEDLKRRIDIYINRLGKHAFE